MRRGDPRLPNAEQISTLGLMEWARLLLVRLYDRFRDIDTDMNNALGYRYIPPTSVTLTAGTSTSTVADLTTLLDGNVFNIVELAATPGFNLSVFFTNVSGFRFVVVRMYYAGSGTHGARIQIRNVVTTNYDTFFVETGDWLDYNMICLPVPNFETYISSTGGVELRIYHSEGGNPSHQINIDYVALLH